MQVIGLSRVAMIVEDEWLVRLEIADTLEEAGWDIVEAASGEEALEMLPTLNHLDLLVTDIRLLGPFTGWDVAEAVRAARPAVGVIYASANPALETRQVDGSIFLGKPSRMADLVAVSEKLWNQTQGR
ncbi:MAG TPA: response regulator [Sphingomonadaceae bacterium]|nr:response regulator [Sphingomonadaceae bacterium]